MPIDNKLKRIIISRKILDLINQKDKSSSSSSSEESEDINYDDFEFKEIKEKVKDINDLIRLGKMYDPTKKIRYNIDLKKLNNLVEPLTKLKNMVGLHNIKKNIVGHIIYYLQDLQQPNDMMHTVIQGPPGVGKTMLGRILGEIYFALGILKGSSKRKRNGRKFIFKVVKRSDLIAKYLGQTAKKTQDVIDSCKGGVMFIDEAYSLGNNEGRDSFSKECIDTINQNLTENKANFLCIIAGYKSSLDKCFFAYNEGLRRRFSFKYTIEKYTPKELRLIFIKMILDMNWIVKEKNIPLSFFEKNYEHFKSFAGDIETLLFNCKIEHGKRVFCYPDQKKIINKEDIDNGFKIFLENRGISKKGYELWQNMFL